MAGNSKSGLHVRWTTVSYSSVAMLAFLLLVLVVFVFYLIAPDTFRAGTSAAGSLLGRIANSSDDANGKPAVGQQQAKFTNIDGVVTVKKAKSNTWVAASIGLLLERGDVVQTSAEGLAKVVFTDGSNYTLKPNSLITIEENSTNSAQQTQVSVQLTTGTVDLYTGTFTQGSKSQVVVSGATASLSPESAAMVRSDPRADEHEIVVKKGAAQVARGSETVRLADYDKVSFKNESPSMTKSKEISPPTLISPANMAPIFARGAMTVDFSWTPVATAHGYHVRISKNPYFSSTVVDKRVEAAEIKLASLAYGAYYWLVQSIDIDGKESVESERNRFTIIPKGPEAVSILLELEPMVQHGHILEIKGRTEPNAKVIINGQEVPDVKTDGSFSFYTLQLPAGENVITITAQNARGGVKTKQEKVVIQ